MTVEQAEKLLAGAWASMAIVADDFQLDVLADVQNYWVQRLRDTESDIPAYMT